MHVGGAVKKLYHAHWRKGGEVVSKILSYKVVFEPAEEGGYTAYVPSLPGCISEGETYEEAIKNIKEAIKGWIEVSRKFGDEIPPSDVIIDTVAVSV